jgi:hypothetical protein
MVQPTNEPTSSLSLVELGLLVYAIEDEGVFPLLFLNPYLFHPVLLSAPSNPPLIPLRVPSTDLKRRIKHRSGQGLDLLKDLSEMFKSPPLDLPQLLG